MCGRFTQHYTWSEVHDALSIIQPTVPPNLEPKYNLGRLQKVDLVRRIEGGNALERALWDLVPFWWKKPLKEKKFPTFNAVSEELLKKKSFVPSWKQGKRCIIPVSGIYEWPLPKQKGQAPFYIHGSHSPILFLAGLWSDWRDPDNNNETLLTCTVLTGAANGVMESIPHHRCPIIIDPTNVERWFTSSLDEAYSLLVPPPDDVMTAYRVSSYVNKIGNEGRECIEPLAA